MRPIRADVSFAEGKQQFLDYVAQRYDDFAADNSDEPPYMLLFAMSSKTGTVTPGYISIGEDDKSGFDAMVAARCYLVLGWELREWEGSYEND